MNRIVAFSAMERWRSENFRLQKDDDRNQQV